MPGDGSSLLKSWLSFFQFVQDFWLGRKERRMTQQFLETHGFDAGKMQNVIILLCFVFFFPGYLIVYLKNGTSNLQSNEHTTVYIKNPTWGVFPRYVFGSHLNVLRFTKLADCGSIQAILQRTYDRDTLVDKELQHFLSNQVPVAIHLLDVQQYWTKSRWEETKSHSARRRKSH